MVPHRGERFWFRTMHFGKREAVVVGLAVYHPGPFGTVVKLDFGKLADKLNDRPSPIAAPAEFRTVYLEAFRSSVAT